MRLPLYLHIFSVWRKVCLQRKNVVFDYFFCTPVAIQGRYILIIGTEQKTLESSKCCCWQSQPKVPLILSQIYIILSFYQLHKFNHSKIIHRFVERLLLSNMILNVYKQQGVMFTSSPKLGELTFIDIEHIVVESHPVNTVQISIYFPPQMRPQISIPME